MDVSMAEENMLQKKIFALFSNDDALKIFIKAKDGVSASSITHTQMKIPSKTYYLKLKKMMDIGLIEKRDGKYLQTTFGNILYEKIILPISKYIQKVDQYKIVDTLKESGKFSENEINNFMFKIFNDLDPRHISITSNMNMLSDHFFHKPPYIKIFWTYEDTVSELLRYIENSSNEILIATRTFNDVLFNALFHKKREGIKLKIICDQNLIKNYFQIFGKTLNTEDKHTKERIATIENPWYECKDIGERRIINIPFGMIIVDGTKGGFEIINQHDTKNFYGSFFTDSNQIVTVLTKLYYSNWNMSLDNKQ